MQLSRYVPGDLKEILEYVAEDSPRNAERLVRILYERCHEIGKQPLLYRLRPELGTDARLAPAGSYVILFRVLHGLVKIERIVHGSRDLVDLLEGDR